MRSKRFIYILFLFGLLSSKNVLATEPHPFSPLNDEIMDFLPPLSELIDSAVLKNPYVRFRNIQMLIEECKLKGIKTEWTRNLGVQGELRYGTYDSYMSSGGSSLSTSTSKELRWNYSTFFNIPLETFINRKNQLRQSKLEKEQAQAMAAVQADELRLAIVRQYNELLLKQKVLKIKSKFKETSEINMQLTEKGFTNGTVPMSEYAMISENYSRAETDFATALVEFQTAYQLLEVLCGTKLNLTNTIQTKNEAN